MTRFKSDDVGPMDLDRWNALWRHLGARVFVDGADVTERCVAFIGAIAVCLVFDSAGRLVWLPSGRRRRELLFGEIEVVIP